jgi:hypothetical protein
MFSRISQVARHLTRPLPNYAHVSAANPRSSIITSSIMAGTQGKSLIHTAACLIIGDEVLGGKVGLEHCYLLHWTVANALKTVDSNSVLPLCRPCVA